MLIEIRKAFCRIANGRVAGYIAFDVRIRRDKNIVANDNFSCHDSPGSDKNLVADHYPGIGLYLDPVFLTVVEQQRFIEETSYCLELQSVYTP